MNRLRISAISFLNTAPLMWDFEHSEAGSAFDISYTLPSGCAAALAEGSADIGIIPAISYALIPGLIILPEVAIAAKGPVRSILLVSNQPLEHVRSMAADTSSRTSVALADVLFRKFLGGRREFVPMAPDLDSMLKRCDSALLIGDSALLVDRSKYLTYDLAELWKQYTGLPFVFAFWAVRQAALGRAPRDLDLADVFRFSRDHGLESGNLAQIAEEWAPRLGMRTAEIIAYLTKNISYDLDDENLRGLELFFRYSLECGLVPKVPDLRFLASLAYLSRAV
jgi:chorismate dehydratase